MVVSQNWGETRIFYNPEKLLKNSVYLMTFKEKFGKNDQSFIILI